MKVRQQQGKNHFNLSSMGRRKNPEEIKKPKELSKEARKILQGENTVHPISHPPPRR